MPKVIKQKTDAPFPQVKQATQPEWLKKKDFAI